MVDKCKTVGIKGIFEGFDAGKFWERARTAKRSIRILDTWTGQLEITRPLREAATRGVSIQILLLNPNSKQAWYRMRDLSTKPGDTPPQQARYIIRNELERLFELCQDSEVNGNIDVRVYDALPTACIYGFDDVNIVGTYWRGLSNIESTLLEVVVPSPDLHPPIAESVHNHFTDLWSNGSEELTAELLQADSQDASSTPAVEVLPQVIKQGTEKYRDEAARMSEFVRKQVRKLSELEAVMPAPDPPNLSGHYILWVDDIPINNAFESHMLQKLGIDITQATSTEEARGFLRESNVMPRIGEQNRFDLIITDLNREEQGGNNPNAGAELFDHIQQDEDLSLYRDVPFIFYSDSVARLDGDRKARAYGATDKPNELIERVTSAVQGIELDEESA
jgi:CheY-like chemotaxis protein